MLKLESWSDFFKFNKETLDDDYNAGQHLVVKAKQKSTDATSEFTTTFKQGVADANGEGKLALETKFKSVFSGQTHEGSLKQDGNVTYDFKSDLENSTKVKGLSFLLSMTNQSAPSSPTPAVKLGLSLENSNIKFKALTNLYNAAIENTLTYKCCSTGAIGYELNLDSKAQKLTKYNLGFAWEPAEKCIMYAKHESLEKVEDLRIGKLWFMFFHSAAANYTVGTEFMLNWQTKDVEARFGLTHKFSDDTVGKVKVNHKGDVNGALKYKFSDMTTAVLTSGFNVNDITKQKAKIFPLGYSFDLKW